MTLHFVTKMGEGLVVFKESRFGFGEQLWVLGSTPQRKHQECQVCSRDLKGERSYRPFGNAGNRYWRICMKCVDLAIGVQGKK